VRERHVCEFGSPSAACSAPSTSALIAIAVPRLSQLPRWIEAELVLGAWWVGWATLLTTLL